MNQSVTLTIPSGTYEQFRQAAEKTKRPITSLLTESIVAVAPILNTDSQNLRSSLAHMTYMNDAALWQAVRTSMSSHHKEQLKKLHIKAQRDGLTDEEQKDEKRLLNLYHETQLVRAQAVVLLKQRNYDVSDPSQFLPLT